MAYYAKISNDEFTVSENARLMEVRQEIVVIEADNRSSEEYATLKTAYEDSFTSDTLQTLQGELAELKSQYTIEMTKEEKAAITNSIVAKQAEIDAEKEALVPGQEIALDALNAKEIEGTEDLVAEIETLYTAMANALCRVTDMYTGVDEFTSSNGEAISEDNSVYWEGFYRGCKRTSYNTQGGVHKLGGTPFRKNYAAVGYIYDPVRDAFYAPQPYPSWTLDEDTCYWEAPIERPEGMEWHWNETTLEWIDKPGVKPYLSWEFGNKVSSWNGSYYGGDLYDGWFAPIECPDASELSSSKRFSAYIWSEEALTWEEQ